MPKFFDKIKDTFDLTKAPGAKYVNRAASRLTPDVIERRIPEAFKNFARAQVLYGPTDIRTAMAALDVDHEIGLQGAQLAAPKHVKGVPVEGILAEVFRPSNLLPVSRAGKFLEKGQLGKPLLAELLKEGGVAGGISAADTLNQGGSLADAAISGGMGLGLGAVTPFGLEGLGRTKVKLLGSKAARAVEDVADVVGGNPPTKTRYGEVSPDWNKMTPEERLKASQPRTVDDVRAVMQANTVARTRRVALAQERIRKPLTARPEGKKGGLYEDDILTIDGKLYPIQVLRADAGEVAPRPFITSGNFKLPDRNSQKKGLITGRKVSLSEQEARALQDLYDTTENPTVQQVQEALKDSAGRSPKTKKTPEELASRISAMSVEMKSANEDLTRLRKDKDATPDDIQTAVDRVMDAKNQRDFAIGEAKEFKAENVKQKTVDGSRARASMVKEYIERVAPTSERTIQRPAPVDTPAYRKAWRMAFDLGKDIADKSRKLEENARAIETYRAQLLDADNVDPAKVERMARGQLAVLRDTLDRKTRNLKLTSPKRAEALDQIAALEDAIQGKAPIPQAVLDSIRESIPKTDTSKTQALLAEAEETHRILTAEQQGARNRLATELGVDADNIPDSVEAQQHLLVQKHGQDVGDLPPVLQPSKAAEVLDTYRKAVQKQVERAQTTIARETEAARRDAALLKAIESGLTGQRVPGASLMTRAGVTLDAWSRALRTRAENPNGIKRPARAVESLSDFARLAMVGAYRDAIADGGDKATLSRTAIHILRERLQNVTNKDKGGAAGRPFIMDGKKRVYGSIKTVQPAETQVDDWLVDFVPEYTAARGIKPGLTVKDIQLQYDKTDGLDAIGRRYDYEKELFKDIQSETEMHIADVDAQNMNLARQRQMSNLKPLTIEGAEVKTKEDLDADVTAAWADFERNLLPLNPAATSNPTTQARLLYEGMVEMLNAPLPRGKPKALQAVQARNALLTEYRTYLAETSGMALDDPNIKELIDESGNPVTFALQLLARQRDPEDIVREPSVRNIMHPKLRGAINFVTGRGFADSRVDGINAGYQYAKKGIAANIWRNFNGLTMQWRRLAMSEMEGQGSVSMRPKALRFAAGDEELRAVLSSHFKTDEITDPTLQKAIDKINELPESMRDDLLDFISREHRFMMDYPELFPSLSKEYKDVAMYGRAQVKLLSDISAATGGNNVSQGHLNSLMVDSELLDHIDAKVVSEGHPLVMLAEAAKAANALGKPLREMLVTGDDLLRGEPLAHWNSSLEHRIIAQVKALIDPDEKFEFDDIIHLPGRWSFRSLDKWKVRRPDKTVDWNATKELQDSLKQLEGTLNRKADWKGLQKLSQSVAQMVLTADANIVSVQGYAAFSSKALYELARSVGGLNPRGGATAMREYVTTMKSIMSDEGYHAWYQSRADDIQYYSSLGMATGVESFIAGPRQNKLPLENLPGIGLLPKTAREFNDLQFNRGLMYLKVTSIDNMIGKANIMRKVGPTSSPFFRKFLGLSEMMDEAAGDSPFFHGQPEHVIKAAIRSVNNKLGGVDMNAQGIVQWRQAVEQVMSITPGFLRAQAGMFSTIATRPHTVEGWMALTGVAEEVMFAAGVATVFALATGNTDKLNVTDMRRADWMALPFDDEYIPMIPRVAIPRLAARVLGETIDAAQGNGFDAAPAIQSFAQGRMSPLLNATLGPTFFETDFLGRRYRDKKDRVIASITSFMPIFLENIITESRESVAQDGWGSLTALSYQTPLQWLGKNMVPRPPLDKLDEIAMNYTSQNGGKPMGWFDLSQPERELLLENPKTKGAYEDFLYYQQRRASPKEQQVEAQFQYAEQRTDELHTQPVRFPDGDVVSMQDLYGRLVAGDIDGDEYRKKLQYVNGRVAENMQSMETNLRRLGIDLGASSDERQKRIRELYKGQDTNAVLTQLAVWDVQSIQPDDFTEPVTVQTTNGPIEFMETDWEAFQEARDAALKTYDQTVQVSALSVMQKWDDEGVLAYKEASQKRQEIEEMPRYEGFTNEQADKIDAMTKSFRDLNDMVRVKIGLPSAVAPLPKGMSKVIRAFAIKSFADSGFIRSEEDLKLATVAMMMQDEPILKEALRGREQLTALLQNPDVLMFYPYLMGRVPTWAQGNLPANLQPQFDVQGRYAKLAG